MEQPSLELEIQTITNYVGLKELDVWYDQYINTVEEPGEDIVEVGEVLPFDNPNFIVYVMDKWVSEQDTQIEKLRRQTDDVFLLGLAFGQRGFTLDEFKYVMSKSRPTDYKNHPVFYYLHIVNEESHDYFVATTNDPEKDITTLYLERVERFILLEIPNLKAFFFASFKKYFPFSSLELHTYVLGGTGSGKSEILKYLFYNLWNKSKERRKYSLISLEPHGKLSYELLQFHLLAEDPKRVVYLDPFLRDTATRLCGEDILGEDYTFVFNPFDLPRKTPADVNYAMQELSFSLFEILESEQASRQMKAVVRACVSTLLVNDGMSIDDLQRFMDDEDNHDLVQKGLRNPNRKHRNFFNRFYNKNISQTKSGIYYRLLSLMDDIHLSRILIGKSTIDIEKEMNAGKVIICNLAKGAMGKESAPMLGKFLVALIQGYATKREGTKYKKPTFLFMDEVQNYITPSVEDIMTESRKYGLHLVLANQILGQRMNTNMLRIIMGNTAIKLCGNADEETQKGMGNKMGLKYKDFDKLRRFHFFTFNEFNKKAGAVMMKVPDNLVTVKAPYYVNKETLKDYFLWLAHDSKYYIKTPPEAPIGSKNRGSESPTQDNRSGGKIYPNDFTD